MRTSEVEKAMQRVLHGRRGDAMHSVDDANTLAAHISAVAAEMRAKAKATRLNTVDPFMSIAVRNAEISEAQLLERFADRLEGRES